MKNRTVYAYYVPLYKNSWRGPKNRQRMKFWLHKSVIQKHLKDKGIKAEIIRVKIIEVKGKKK